MLENRPKIAILDTGIDMSDAFISKHEQRITVQSFLLNDNSVEDIHGHGTHAAALLLRIARNADIYVARITKTQHLSDLTSVEKVRYHPPITVSKIRTESMHIVRSCTRRSPIVLALSAFFIEPQEILPGYSATPFRTLD